MRPIPGDLVRVRISSLPVWVDEPTPENVVTNTLLGILDKNDMILVLENMGNGTAKCLTRFSTAYVVSSFLRRVALKNPSDPRRAVTRDSNNT